MKNLGKLIAVAVLALTFMPTPTQADPGTATHMRADVTITIGDVSCSWLDAPLSANPPNTLTIYLSQASYHTCSGIEDGTSVHNPIVTFNDAFASAIADKVSLTGTRLGFSCTYEATNIALTGDVSTRDYSGTFTAIRVSGSSFICPSTAPGSMTVDFH